jgi:hypothetical protein
VEGLLIGEVMVRLPATTVKWEVLGGQKKLEAKVGEAIALAAAVAAMVGL